MRIKRLDICGFKSFMERSVFSFDDGITGVVGPNGCGKSNVVDAIRWVMGEQSAKNLRGRGMEDVIFNGSESKAPLSMAEVSLTFKIEADDQLAPQYAGFGEVTVTRRLFRSGESEYLINKTVCRLLDVTELFLGTGVGTKAYSIIEQGRVGLIVSSKPEDRRSLIEEAAGVTKYKARRKAAERKMEYTQQNLLRVNDIVSELEKRIDSLERQAKKAEKYKRLKGEMREIELHSAAHRFLELQAERKVLEGQLGTMGEQERESLDKVRELEAAIGDKRARLDDEALALQKLQEDLAALERQTHLDDQNLEHWKKDAEETRARIATANAELEALSQKQQELAQAIAAREAELTGLSGTWKEDEIAMVSAQEEQRRVVHQQSDVALRLEQERNALLSLIQKVANHESNLAALARQRQDLEARKAKNRAEAEGLRTEEQGLDKARADVASQVAERRQMALELAERRGQEEEALARTRQAFAESDLQVISLREELGDKRSRLHSLEEIARTYEGFDRGVRAVMLKAGAEARQQGIFGLVADVISTTPRFEKAIEAALGERLQHVVVESREKGLELVEYLRTLSEGRSTFLPVPVSGARELAQPDLARPGVAASALEQVKCEDALRPVVEAILGDVVIMVDLESARAYAQEGGGAGFTLVTLEGEVLRAGRVGHRRRARGRGGGRAPEEARDRRALDRGRPGRGALQRDPHPPLLAPEADRPHRGRAQGAGEEPARRGAEPRLAGEGPPPRRRGPRPAPRPARRARPRGRPARPAARRGDQRGGDRARRGRARADRSRGPRGEGPPAHHRARGAQAAGRRGLGRADRAPGEGRRPQRARRGGAQGSRAAQRAAGRRGDPGARGSRRPSPRAR